jgi:predicted metal-binding membrane protein
VPLPPRGWRAEKAALVFGARNGLACLGSCWCLMLVMYLAPGGRLWWSIAITGLVVTERLRRRPGEAVRLAGMALGSAGLWTLILGIG